MKAIPSSSIQGYPPLFGDASQETAKPHQLLLLALDHVLQGVALFDSSSTLVYSNTRYATLLELSEDFLRPGIRIREIVAATIGERAATRYVQTIAPSSDRSISEYQSRSGRWVEVQKLPLPDGGWLAILTDITEHRKVQETIDRLANLDPLTGLSNRSSLREFLSHHVAACTPAHPFALHTIDINGFHSINDTFGRTMGDLLLQAVADRIRNCLLPGYKAARISADEFSIVQTGIRDQHDAEALASCIVAALSQPYHLDGQEVLADASIGIALAPRDAIAMNELIRHSTSAVHRARMAGNRGFSFFEPDLDEWLADHRSLEQDLRQALRRNEFQVFYQPLVDIFTEAPVGFEALIRWFNPCRGFVSPSTFIPVAERCGLILAIGNWVLETALCQAASWPDSVKIAVNVSAAQLRDPDFPTILNSALRRAAVPADRLELEITESVLMDRSQTTLESLRAIQATGVRIALDDFGTGYSSLSYLRQFPFNRIKMDQSFIREMSASPQGRILCRAIADLGISLGMQVTAEGVETADQLDNLRRIGCTEAQGFYFSKPQPPTALTEALETAERAHRRSLRPRLPSSPSVRRETSFVPSTT